MGVARSGVKGPLMWGSSSDKFYEYVSTRGEYEYLKVTYDFDFLVVLSTLVGSQIVREALSVLSNIATTSCLEVVGHTVVEGEHRGGSTNLGTHVTDGSHARARKRLDTGTGVLDDGAGTTLDGEDAGNLEDNV